MTLKITEGDLLTRDDLGSDCIEDCASPGPSDDAVDYWVTELDFEVDPDSARRHLIEAGIERERVEAWDARELAEYILWIACCDLREGNPFFIMGV